MVEVTQIDREAAAAILEHRGRHEVARSIKLGQGDGHHMPQAFAAHRLAAEQRIVEWLREEALQCPSWDSEIADALVARATMIETGAHRK